MKEFKKFYNKSVGIDEKVIVRGKNFFWTDPSGEYSMQIEKEPNGLGFSVFYVENNTEFKMLMKDATELYNWLGNLLESKKIDEYLDPEEAAQSWNMIEDELLSAIKGLKNADAWAEKNPKQAEKILDTMERLITMLDKIK